VLICHSAPYRQAYQLDRSAASNCPAPVPARRAPQYQHHLGASWGSAVHRLQV